MSWTETEWYCNKYKKWCFEVEECKYLCKSCKHKKNKKIIYQDDIDTRNINSIDK